MKPPLKQKECYLDKYEEPERHLEALAKASVITLDLPPRLLFPLWKAGIRTVGQLIYASQNKLEIIPQIGSVAAIEIKRILISLGLIDAIPMR